MDELSREVDVLLALEIRNITNVPFGTILHVLHTDDSHQAIQFHDMPSGPGLVMAAAMYLQGFEWKDALLLFEDGLQIHEPNDHCDGSHPSIMVVRPHAPWEQAIATPVDQVPFLEGE